MTSPLNKHETTNWQMRHPIFSHISLVVIPLLISLGIAALFYPGYMSYDTLHALRGARNGVTDSVYPPMVSYAWRAIDLLSTNPSAMHFSQIFLLLMSFFLIAYIFTNRIKYATTITLIYICIPIILGSLAVIWKDILMAAFFMSGFAIIISARLIRNKLGATILSILSIILIFLGICSRHNAIAGAVPLLFYVSWVLSSHRITNQFRLWISTITVGVVLTCTLFATKTLLDKYSLPDLKKMESSTPYFIRIVRIMDVAGASVCVGKNLFDEMAPNMSVEEIKTGYHPRHVLESIDLVNKIGINGRIDKIWLNVAKNHPVCFFNNKFLLFKNLIGANNKTQFIITAPGIIENEYGYALPKSRLRDVTAAYIVHASWLPLFKPWFLYLISAIAFVYMFRVKALTAEYFTLYLSAVFYFCGLVALGNAADGRLSFYTTTAVIMFLFVSIVELKKKLSVAYYRA